ncbi:hypothetical protein J5N97_022983 [Dioscorea zingiberensis]|uniref:Protein EXECUTER 1, chloroplastic n=1 Tax=Dioscorea zingiberensis TaxID=325984 RepID=A0A9D5CBK5_9LILI|nr:hypothetical protein J5N97_022983 [Dioscorea zingiberensis]
MASISAPSYLHAERSPARLIFTDRSCSFPAFSRSPARSSRHLESTLCRCSRGDASSPSGSGRRRWDTMIQDVLRKAVKRWDDYVNRSRNSGQKDAGNLDALKEEKMGEEVEWDWDRWNKHFAEVEEQERLVDALKLQLRIAAAIEDYKEAVKLKAAITIATKNDAVGTAISDLNRAIAEERYNDAAFLRDHAGVGLMGWWAGISTNVAGAHGQIIHISAEHGRYVARSYSSRQLATARPGYPLFEIFFTVIGGEYKQQAVYLKRNDRPSGGFQWEIPPKTKVSSLSPSDSSSDPHSDIYVEDLTAVEERDDDSDMVDGLAGIQNVLQDMIPGVKIKILKVVAPGKVDGDMISKVIEQIVEEEDEDNDEDLESGEAENSASETDNEDAVDSQDTTSDAEELLPEFPVKFVIGTLMQNLSDDLPPKDLVRVPAIIKRKDHRSFSFSVQQNDMHPETDGKERLLGKKGITQSDQQSTDLVMSDLAKVLLSKEKIPLKVLKDIGELISSAIRQDQNKPFSGTMSFNRIELPSYADPLSGLYIGAHGIYASEILHLKRKFGQWQENDGSQRHDDLEFYEYVEALKLTGSLSVPAGQVVFRAKVGKKNQLPHKGIIPEEFGVVARYKGQGRFADTENQNPRWVDGELVILDGKLIKGGPVIGFVYWAPEYHFMVFFIQLKLPE